MKQIQLVSDFQSEIKCPKCGSINYQKNGKRKNLQIYKCKNCSKSFSENSRISPLKQVHSRYRLPENISPQEMKLLDCWDLRILGKKPDTKGNYSINFIDIHPDWLKQAFKDFIWFKVANKSTSTIAIYVSRFRFISDFIQVDYAYSQPIDINRTLTVDLINHISSFKKSADTVGHYISLWKSFSYFCQENGIIPKSSGRLVFEDDYPKRKKSQIKDIPDYVLKQLKSKIYFLAKPILLTVEILLETGMRIDEICTLQINCITQDSDGDWWLECSRSKVYKDDRLFISKELAMKIQEQQKFIRDNFKDNFNYLFCTTEGNSWFAKYATKREGRKKREIDYFVPIAKRLFQAVVRGYLKQLAHEHNITDVSGQIYPIWKCHRFRHTHLTDLARKGTGIAHIMQRAGHASAEMAMQYIHLTDDDQKKKMKEVWDNTHFNMEGEIVAPVNPDLDTADMQWIKKGMGMQTTDNGYCTLLWTQTCPHQDLPCKGCGSWVTTLDFLDSHKQELEETEKIIENARVKGYQRQIEKNVPRADRLKKIISGMEKHASMRGIGHNDWEEKE